ncbi:glycosyltransferase [Pseudotabrizicola sp.]|uniref:glycosyltransferase n=1 Tax=Pseudotabrizicola sp. TaxID=2939647 RepID=UPI002717D401|nr:glycosyltransferase [Pseudotabrizicola sp.]MDO8883847.1 glycosyltransferase [Pseudotabrizicola sp.]
MSVLLVCTRDPRGRLSGRKMVLNTIIASLEALGHDVTIAYFSATDDQPDPAAPTGQRYVCLPNPLMLERLWGGLRWLFTGRPSLNEALYFSRRAARVLDRLAKDVKADVVITDMLRTAQYGVVSGLPWIADLDDLLSRRYTILAESYTPSSNILGYYGSRVGRLALRTMPWLMPWVLRREAASLTRREIEVARLATVCTLVSVSEAKALSQASGRNIQPAPMAVTGPTNTPTQAGRVKDLVFLGGLDYGPNLKSVLQYDQHICPALRDAGLGDVKLHVIGHPDGNAPLFSKSIVLEGYVDDLDTALQTYRAMLVPQVLPGGVKTKIIVAALNGTLVLAHSTALDGMGLQHGREILCWESSEDLAKLIKSVEQNEFDIPAITMAARLWADRGYSPKALQATWQDILERAVNHK